MKKLMTLIMILALIIATLAGCTKSTEVEAASDSKADADSMETVEQNDFEKFIERGYVVVGLDDTFAPMGFRTTDGELVGFDVEMAKAAFEKMGMEARFQPIEWSMKETELNSGNIDMIWNGYTITDQRLEKVNFTKPYLKNRQVIVTLPETGITTLAELEGKSVACQNESSSYDAIMKAEAFVSTLDGGTPITFETNNEAFMDLEAGRVEAVVADEILAMYYIGQKGVENFVVFEEDLGKEEYGVGVRKSDTVFLEKLNGALGEMKSDGTAAEISIKYFGKDIVEK